MNGYDDGLRAGRLDRAVGHRSEYAWFGIHDANPYTVAYAWGYRAGWEGLA